MRTKLNCKKVGSMKFSIENRPFLPFLKIKSKLRVNNGGCFWYKLRKCSLEIELSISGTIFEPILFIFAYFPGKVQCCIKGSQGERKIHQKMLHNGELLHNVSPVYLVFISLRVMFLEVIVILNEVGTRWFHVRLK